MNIRTKTLSGVVAGLALVGILAGCSAPAQKAYESKPKGPLSAAEEKKVADDMSFNECVDGEALVAPKKGENTVEIGDCDSVFVMAEGATVTVGKTKKIGFEGTGNTVIYTGDAPEVMGATEGDGNTIRPAG